MSPREELDQAYREYYAERHAMEDANVDPNEWELQLWEKYEPRFIAAYVKGHP